MPRGVMVAREILDLFVKVRVLARQPLVPHERLTLSTEITNVKVRTGIRTSPSLSADVQRCQNAVKVPSNAPIPQFVRHERKRPYPLLSRAAAWPSCLAVSPAR